MEAGFGCMCRFHMVQSTYVLSNKSSEVAEVRDRLATIDIDLNVGVAMLLYPFPS